jgi:hypothetical protein
MGTKFMRNDEKQIISMLLPYYWWEDMPRIFELLGFKILWPDYEEVSQRRIETEKLVMNNNPDLAIEWQWGPDDFPIRDLLRKYGRKTPVVLALNRNVTLPGALSKIGCAGCLNVPFKLTKMFSVFYKVLPEKKKRDFLHLHETNKYRCLFRIK